MAMLAAARIGAIHLVVFAGFGAGALAERMRLAGARVLLTADVTYRKGRDVDLWAIAREALADPDSPVEHVVVLLPRRRPATGRSTRTRDLTWEEFLAPAAGQSTRPRGDGGQRPGLHPGHLRHHRQTEARRPHPRRLPGRHPQHGRLVLRAETGPTSGGRRPTSAGRSATATSSTPRCWPVAPTIAYEGALDHPTPETFYRIVAEKRVTGIFTAPTAVRMLMAYGAAPARAFDLSSVERVVCAGEALNIPAWEWLQKEVFARSRAGHRPHVADRDRRPGLRQPLRHRPAADQARLGRHPAARASSPRSAPPRASPARPGEKGIVVLTRPFPRLTPTIWGDPERYARDYWGRIPGAYFTGDAAAVDEDGYFWFSGRADEIIKIAGHRIGTIEVETAFLRHPAVAEAGVSGRPDELRGEVISAFVVLRPGHAADAGAEGASWSRPSAASSARWP